MKRSLTLGLAAPLLALLVACQNGPTSPAGDAAKPATAPAAGDGQIAATIGGEAITMAELDQKVGGDVYEMRSRALDNMVAERVLEKEAKAAGLEVEAYLKQTVETRVPEVSEAEAQQFFAENQARLGPQFAGKSFEEVKPMIVQGLTNQKRQQAVGEVIEELKAKNDVKIMLEPPRVEVAAVGPAKGPESAPVTIVEFSDFECPYCSRGKEVMDQVVAAYGDKVRVVFRDYPLPFHHNAQKAAEAGHCAHEQGKFWEMHDWMFANQKSLKVEDLKAAAGTLNLDANAFAQCLDSGKYAEQVATNMKAGQEAGVSGTPAFFVNGVFMNGAQPFEKFKAVIDQELAKAQ